MHINRPTSEKEKKVNFEEGARKKPALLHIGSSMTDDLKTPMRAVKATASSISHAIAAYIFLIITTAVVRLVRWHMDTFWSWYQEKKWLTNAANYAQDGLSVMEGVKDIRLERYGALHRETCHVLTPTAPRTKDGVLVYVHGGGFVVANSTVLLHSVTLFCRHGYTVYSIDYPHAPEHRFPRPLASVLQALHWLRTEKGIECISLFGDSAGIDPPNPHFFPNECLVGYSWFFPSVIRFLFNFFFFFLKKCPFIYPSPPPFAPSPPPPLCFSPPI